MNRNYEAFNLTELGNQLREQYGLSHKAAGLIDGARVEQLLETAMKRVPADQRDLLLPFDNEITHDLARYLAELESLQADARAKGE